MWHTPAWPGTQASLDSPEVPAIVSRRAPDAPALASRRVRTLAERMLRELGLYDAELSVHLTDDATMVRLNRQYRGTDRSTDVLAFPLDSASDTGGTPPAPRLLGDIVISVDAAQRQARRRGVELLAEVTLLLAHGLLHLAGHEHRTAEERRAMTRVTRRLVRAAAGRQPATRPAGIGRRARR
jgi:probable rRNA maturation factor